MTDPIRFSWPALRAFELAFRPFQRLRLRTIVNAPSDFTLWRDRPVVLVANHVSWWDGFLLRDLHRVIAPERPLYTLMLARELRRHRFFRRLGAVPIEPRTSSVLGTFRALQRLRAVDPAFCVSYFPQGQIRPSWQRPLDFERGVSLLIRRLAPCTVLPVALHIEPLNHARPTAFVHTGAALYAGGELNVSDIEARVRMLLDQLLGHIAEHGEAAADVPVRLLPPARPFDFPVGRGGA